eukprot:269455_1
MSTPNITATTDDVVVSASIFENCDDPSLWTATSGNEITLNFTYNYLAPCTGNTNDKFGGFANQCDTIPQDISLQCTSLIDCSSDLRACYSDWQDVGFDVACGDLVDKYDEALRNGEEDPYKLAKIVSVCSFRYYTTASDCCREAINSQILPLPQYSCKAITASFQTADSDSLQSVCQATDKCQFDGTACTEVPANRVFDDCYRLISGVDTAADCSLSTLNINDTQIRRGEQDAFHTCMSTAVNSAYPGSFGTLKRSGSDTCKSVFDTQSATYANCLYPVDSFYDVGANKYDYSMCSDYTFTGTCGTGFNDTDTQLDCLIENV